MLLLFDCLSCSNKGGCHKGKGEVGVVGGAGVLGFEVILVGEFREVDSGDVEEVGLVGHGGEVGAQATVVVVEGGGNGVVATGYSDHHNYQYYYVG